MGGGSGGDNNAIVWGGNGHESIIFANRQNERLRITDTGLVRVPDNGKFVAGTSDDLQIYHDGANSYVSDQGTGDLRLSGNVVKFNNQANTATMIKATQGDSVELYHNNAKKLETGQFGVTVTGSLAASNIDIADNAKLLIGNSDDLQIFHDGNNNYIQGVSGNLILKNNTADYFVGNNSSGSVELNYNGSKKFETIGIGVSIVNGTSDTATIAAPANLILDPAVVGDNTGIVRIKGDLFVDGTTTQINSTSLEIADFIVGIASTATTDLLADGAGIQIGPDNTFLYEHNGGTNPSLKSSENLNVASGKGYQINQTEVLNATTLGSGVTNSSLTSVGTLSSLNVSGVSTFKDNIVIDDGSNSTNQKLALNNSIQSNQLVTILQNLILEFWG